MHPNGILICLLLIFSVSNAVAQFKNIMLDQQGDSDARICEPVIAINPRRPNNVVAGAFPDKIYFTRDAGTTWSKAKPVFPVGISGDPTLIPDPKGNFYYFHLSGNTAGSGEEISGATRIALQSSDDGGETWHPGEFYQFTSAGNQSKEWATVDGRGSLFVTWTQYEKSADADSACRSNIMFTMSKNAKKWTEPVVISQSPGDCAGENATVSGAMPAVTFDGKAFVAWSNQGKIFLDRSFSGGSLWLNNDITVVDKTGGLNLEIPGHGRCNGMPVLMADNSKSQYRGSLYLVWADQRNGENDTDIWFTRSHNFGDNWSSPSRINNDGKGKHQYMPWITVDPETGYLYVLYYDRRNYEDNQTDVYLAYSTDGGASFKNALISEKPFHPREGEVFGDNNSLSAHGGVVMPVWTRTDDGKTSIWTATITQEALGKVAK